MKQSNAPAKGNTRSWKETFHNAKVQQTLTICAFLAIPMILLVMFTYLPLADMIRYSLYRWDGYSDMKFIGLDNYKTLFSDMQDFSVFKTSIYYFVGSLIQIAIALYFATMFAEKRDHYLRIVSDETKRLSRLVRSMLDISQLQKEQGIPEEKKMHFDLEECAGQVLITFEKKINDKKLNVDVNFPEHPVYTMANQDYITQVIYNLLDNAVKFCPEGGTLGLTIREGGSKAYVSVSNDGETIPPEELPLVFDRFHKLDKSRSQNRDGWGLGLYIVKTIVCCHGENISVSSKDGKTEFTFTMPLVN